MIDGSLLNSFLVLAETRNFTSAAKKLFRSQSAISLQIAKLEALLGKTLFTRNNRNVSLTLEGEQLIGYAKQILRLENEMLSFFRQPVLQGEVFFGIPEDLATVYLPAILADFVDMNPKVFIQVHCEFTINLSKGFDRGDYDLILIKEDPHNPHPNSEKIGEESLVWVSKKGFCIQENLPLVLAPAPCVYRERAIDALNREEIRWKLVYSSPSLTGALAAVRAGIGVTVLPIEMVPKDLCVHKNLPLLKPAQIGLLKQPGCSDAVDAFGSFVKGRLLGLGAGGSNPLSAGSLLQI